MRGREAVGLVVRREIAERLREKAFAVSTGINIVIIVAVVIVAAILSGDEERYVVGYTAAPRRRSSSPRRPRAARSTSRSMRAR